MKTDMTTSVLEQRAEELTEFLATTIEKQKALQELLEIERELTLREES